MSDEISSTAAPEAPARQLIPTGKSPEYFSPDGTALAASSPEAAEIRRASGVVDPAYDLTSDDLLKLQKESPDKFNLLGLLHTRPDVQQNPEALQRISDAFTRHVDTEGFGLPKNLEEAKKTVGSLWDMAKGAVKTVAVGAPALVLENVLPESSPL